VGARNPGSLNIVQTELVQFDSAVAGRVETRQRATLGPVMAHLATGQVCRRQVQNGARIAPGATLLELGVVPVRGEHVAETVLRLERIATEVLRLRAPGLRCGRSRGGRMLRMQNV